MPSSRLYAFGEPENDGERRVIRYLDDHLPPEYRIYHNLEREGGGQTYEWDVLVLAPHALFCLEVKDWPGRIVGNDREWLLNGNAVRRNPCPLITKKARILKNRLLERDSFLRSLWVEGLVVIADDRVELALGGECARYTVTLGNVVARVTDTNGEQWRGSDHRARFPAIDRILTVDFRPMAGARQVAHFRLLEQISATDLYTEWRAENRLAGSSVKVRLKIYAPDPYLPAAEQQQQRLLIGRDFEAAGRIGSHPNLRGARDFFPDEGGRYILVLDDLAGTSLAAEQLAGRSLTFERKLQIVEDVADGLTHAHGCQVIHRDVRPGNIWLAPTDAMLINFDCARVGNLDTIAARVEAGLDPSYLAPEVIASAASATAASDIYALGVVLYELLTGRLPSDDEQSASPSTFDPLVDTDLDDLTLKMIAREPAARPSAAEVRDVLADLRLRQRAPTHTPGGSTPETHEPTLEFAPDEIIEGQYLVRESLGEGSFGKVYRVYSSIMDREYAMKLFRNPGLGLEEAQQEFRALVELTHPRIARVWHAGQLRQGVYYLLTDYVTGRPLHKLLGADRPGPRQALGIVQDLLRALDYLHGRGYVHRDIKPSNLIVSSAGTWLIDFSIATASSTGQADRAGTPLYTPPDVTECGAQPSRDLFAAGVVLYELITGRHPYDGLPRPGLPPRDPMADQPRLTGHLATVLRRAVAPTAGARYMTAEEFLQDLAAVEEPLLPPPPQYPLASGIVLSAEERGRVNYNPYLARFLTLYSQNRRDNSGTRGYDEVSRATYVRTRLDKRLAPDILQGKFRLVLVTGNAGDGKTAFLQSLEERVAAGGDQHLLTDVVELPSGNGTTFELDGRVYRTNYDGSQNEGNLQNDEVLADFFAPFAGQWEEVEANSAGLVRLIAINEGKLREFLARRREDYPWLDRCIEAHLEDGTPLPDSYLLVNLNERSVVAGESNILDQQIQALCDPVFWEPCRPCVYAGRCPVKFNIDTFNHPDLGPRAGRRLHRLFEIAHLRGRMHLTMRAVRSALAFILLGEEDCGAIAIRLETPDEGTEVEEQLLRRFYYNAVACNPSASHDGNRESWETDRLLRLISEADVGLGANPADDRDLFFNGARASSLLPSVGGRSDYERELLMSVAERLAASGNGEETSSACRRLHATLRRKAFFERPDDGWEGMLPYALLQPMLSACQGDDGPLADLKSLIVRGINQGEGLRDIGDRVVLRLARGVPGRVKSFRQFPAADFLLRPACPSAPSDYVEYSPAHLELIHRVSSNGRGSGRPTLRLGLDLLELLGRMAKGYAPTAAEWRGGLVNLLVYRTLLAHEQYDELLLVDALEERRFLVKQRGGQIALARLEVRDATH